MKSSGLTLASGWQVILFHQQVVSKWPLADWHLTFLPQQVRQVVSKWIDISIDKSMDRSMHISIDISMDMWAKAQAGPTCSARRAAGSGPGRPGLGPLL